MDGRSLRILNVVDEHTRVAVGCRVARSIGARAVIGELERLFQRHGKPMLLRSDSGREFIAATSAGRLPRLGRGTGGLRHPKVRRRETAVPGWLFERST